MITQDSFIMREPEDAEVEFGEDGKDVCLEIGIPLILIWLFGRLFMEYSSYR